MTNETLLLTLMANILLLDEDAPDATEDES